MLSINLTNNLPHTRFRASCRKLKNKARVRHNLQIASDLHALLEGKNSHEWLALAAELLLPFSCLFSFSLPITTSFFKFIYLFIYLFLAVLGLRFCARAFCSCGTWGPLFIAVHGPLTARASHYRGPSCCRAQARVAQAQ